MCACERTTLSQNGSLSLTYKHLLQMFHFSVSFKNIHYYYYYYYYCATPSVPMLMLLLLSFFHLSWDSTYYRCGYLHYHMLVQLLLHTRIFLLLIGSSPSLFNCLRHPPHPFCCFAAIWDNFDFRRVSMATYCRSKRGMDWWMHGWTVGWMVGCLSGWIDRIR